MRLIKKITGSLFLLCALAYPLTAYAIFGVSPASIGNDYTKTGTVLSQTVFIGTDAKEDSLIKIDFTGDREIKEWMFESAGETILPAGTDKFPLTFKFSIPPKAIPKSYAGTIFITAEPVKPSAGTGAKIAMGAAIRIKFTVIKAKITAFKVHHIEPSFDPKTGIVELGLTLENTGNTTLSTLTTKATVYGDKPSQILAAGTSTKITEAIPAYETGETSTSIFLKGGKTIENRWADVKILNGKISVFNQAVYLKSGEVSQAGLREAAEKLVILGDIGLKENKEPATRPAAEEPQGLFVTEPPFTVLPAVVPPNNRPTYWCIIFIVAIAIAGGTGAWRVRQRKNLTQNKK